MLFNDADAPKRSWYLAGLFTRYFCHAEMAEARAAGLEIVGVMEEDARHGRPNFEQERQRALTGGKNNGPVHPQAGENIKFLDTVSFIPRRTQEHEVRAMVDEILKCGLLPLRRGSFRSSFSVPSSASSLDGIVVQNGSSVPVRADLVPRVRSLLIHGLRLTRFVAGTDL